MLPQLQETDKPTSDIRLLADAMLGKLAKWLRLLGYDTLYDPAWDDATIARLARAEGRIVLTRDRELAARLGPQALPVVSDRWQEQLLQVMRELDLSEAAAGTRCSICNGRLQRLDAEEAARFVPPYVLRTQEVFHRCPTCGRIYWPGGHWERIQKLLRAATDQAVNGRSNTPEPA